MKINGKLNISLTAILSSKILITISSCYQSIVPVLVQCDSINLHDWDTQIPNHFYAVIFTRAFLSLFCVLSQEEHVQNRLAWHELFWQITNHCIHVLYESITCQYYLAWNYQFLPGKWIQGKKKDFPFYGSQIWSWCIYGLLASFQTSGMKMMPIIVYATTWNIYVLKLQITCM